MQKWEYRIVVADIDWDDESDKPNGIDKGRLSQLGNEGWELVGMAPVTGPLEGGSSYTVEIQYVFKRPRSDNLSKEAAITPKDASRIQSAGDRKPESKTAKTDF